MTCVHLRQLVQLCQDSEIRLSSSDLIHMVCHKCNMHEVCPSQVMDDSEGNHDPASGDAESGGEDSGQQ